MSTLDKKHPYLEDDVQSFMEEFGIMMDYVVSFLHYNPNDFIQMFLATNLPLNIEHGNPKYILGKSGRELAYDVICKYNNLESIDFDDNNWQYQPSIDYWSGSMLVLYQWHANIPYKEILENVSLDDIYKMYSKYHQMDETKFLDRMDEIISKKKSLEIQCH